MVHTSISGVLTDGQYDNLSFNPLTGRVSALLTINNTFGYNTSMDVVLSISDSDSGAFIKNVNVTVSINPFQPISTIEFNTTFVLPALPNNVGLKASGTIATEFGRANILSSEIIIVPFTGTRPEDIDPKPDMVNLVLVPKGFTNTRLEFEKIATKTNTFPSSFDNKSLKFIVQVKDTNGIVLQLGEIPFVFGSNTEFIKNTIITANFPDEIQLQVVIWTSDNFPISNVVDLNLTVSSPSPTDNFRIEAIAENGFAINGTVTQIDFDFLNSPNGVIIHNATITGVPISEPALLTANQVMNFLANNIVGEPPPPENNFFVTVTAENGSIASGIITNVDLAVLQAGLPSLQGVEENVPNTSPPTTTAIILLQFAEDNQIISPPPPPPEPTNKDIIVFAENGQTLSGVVTVADFDALVNSLPEFQANITGVDTTQTPNETFISVLDFARSNQIGGGNDDSVITGMVTTNPMNMQIKLGSDTITGNASFIANESFNSFWYGKDILSFIQITFPDDTQIIKENPLNFTLTERDELINYIESAHGFKSATVEFFVWVSLSDTRAFAFKKTVELTEGKPPITDIQNGKVVSIIKGSFFGLMALALLGSRGR